MLIKIDLKTPRRDAFKSAKNIFLRVKQNKHRVTDCSSAIRTTLLRTKPTGFRLLRSLLNAPIKTEFEKHLTLLKVLRIYSLESSKMRNSNR